jgi:chaperone LolA
MRRVPSVFIWFGLATTGWAQEMSPADADAFIEQLAASRSAKGAVTVAFNEERALAALAAPVTTEGTLTFQPPNKFRRETRGERGSVAVSDGKTFWIYYPAFREAERYDLNSQRFLQDTVTALMASMNAENLRREFRYRVRREGGIHVLELEPKRASLRKAVRSITLRIRPDFTAESNVMVFPEGDRATMTFSNEKPIRPSGSEFTFTPPAGTRVSTPLGR